MKDQVRELSCLGLKAFALGLDDNEGEKELHALEFLCMAALKVGVHVFRYSIVAH